MDEKRKSFGKIKNISGIAGQNILIVLVIVLVVSIAGIECYRVLNVKLRTQTAEAATVYDVLETRALFIRDEKSLSDGNGVTLALVSDGEKINTGGEIAMVFSSSENAAKYASYMELENEHEYYTDMQNMAVGNATDIEKLESDILDSVNGYIRSAALSDTKGAEENAAEINNGLTRRALLIGENVDFSSALSDVESKMNALDINSCKPVGYITAESSGTYSRYTDGCEGVIDYSSVKNMDIAAFDKYLNVAASANGNTDGGGKIISSFEWYMCCVVNTSDVIELEDGYNVQVVVKSTGQVLKCTVVKGADVSVAEDQTLLVLSCNEIDTGLAAMRLEDIEIRVKEYTGIKVSPSAVYELNGEQGVYALVSNIAKWRRADVLYTGEDYVILSFDNGRRNELKLYDEIIINGRDVYDGKVYA